MSRASPATKPAAGGRILGANDRIRIGVAGIKGQGGQHISGFMGVPNVEIAYLVDPDSELFAKRIRQVEDAGGNTPKCVQDVREALEDKELDAISIATPNHWHSLMTIWACQAGKDVYVEKPLSHNIHEGRMAVLAARKYNRIVQHGTQRRSDPGWREAIAAIHSGKLGKLLMARGVCYKSSGGRNTRGNIGYAPPKQPPATLDWDLWLGPAPWRHYHENLVHYRWHWFLDFGNGDTGNMGAHMMDVARWGLKGGTLPKSVISFGGRIMGEPDQADAPNTEVSIMDFGDAQLIFEMRGLKSESYQGVGTGNMFHTEGGVLIEKKWYPEGASRPQPLPRVDFQMGPGEDRWSNFIAAMRSRKPSDLNADVLEGHYSSALCHLATTSTRLGEKIPFYPRVDVFDDNPFAVDALNRTEEYLAANGLDLSKLGYSLGRHLTIDQQAESIINDDQANAILNGFYRAPYLVPESI